MADCFEWAWGVQLLYAAPEDGYGSNVVDVEVAAEDLFCLEKETHAGHVETTETTATDVRWVHWFAVGVPTVVWVYPGAIVIRVFDSVISQVLIWWPDSGIWFERSGDAASTP